MLIRLVRALRSRDDERGVALAAVIGLGAVLMIVLSLVVATATSGATKASNDDDYNKAMAAAYAGLSDYQGRLAADNAYVRYGVRTPFSGESTYSTDTVNKAFGTTVGGTWAPVVGAPISSTGTRSTTPPTRTPARSVSVSPARRATRPGRSSSTCAVTAS